MAVQFYNVQTIKNFPKFSQTFPKKKKKREKKPNLISLVTHIQMRQSSYWNIQSIKIETYTLRKKSV